MHLHPVQNRIGKEGGYINSKVTQKAYEVYKYLFGSHDAIITGNCRGGFSSGELIAFLYCHSFPKTEWKDRFEEAISGMKNL